MDPGETKEADGLFNTGFSNNPDHFYRKLNDWTDITVDDRDQIPDPGGGGTASNFNHGLDFSFDSAMDLFMDIADPRTGPWEGWKDDDWYDRNFGNFDPPICRSVCTVVARVIGWTLQVALVGGWLLISSLYIRAAWLLGHLPSMERDDPKGLDFGMHYELVGLAVIVVLVATVVSCVLGIVFAVVERISQSRRASCTPWRLFTSGVLSVLVWWLFPFVSWYLD